MGLLIQESSQSLHRLLVEWETCQNPDYLGKSKNWRQTCDPEMSKSNMDCWGNQAGLFKEIVHSKMGLYVNPKTDWAINRSVTHLLLKIRFQKSKHHLFEMVPNLAFLGKKRPNYWPRARAERNPDTAKNLSNQGWHCFRFLCILLVPNALPKRERSLWLPPQNVLRQGWLGHYYKSFPDNWDQVFLR